MSWLGKTAKSLFIFTLLYFSFGLTIQGGVWERVISQVSQVSQSHDKYEKVVHRPYSSCISSVQKNGNPIEFSLLT